jgi:GNAT superfamily N-acetyltransferase
VNQRLGEFDKPVFGGSAHGDITAIVAVMGGSPVAGVTLFERLGWTHIERLWVEPDHRRNGLGTRLIRECELRADSLGHFGVRLTTTTRHMALSLYLSLGFSIDACWPLVSRSGSQLEEIALSKQLSR